MTQTTEPSLLVNGAERQFAGAAERRLIDVLRDDLGLTGTKEGCDDGSCGTCSVIMDGRLVRACRIPIGEALGRSVTTIEGLGTPEDPHPLQAAFVAADAVQCGFCTPGMILAAQALLERDERPSREAIVRWLGSNLCRCTGYQSIVDAVDWVARGRTGPVRPLLGSDGGGGGAVRLDALAKACGVARYAADLVAPGMLHGRVLRSPVAHADVVAVDPTDARRMPGVVAVLTADDIPGARTYGRKLKDQPVLADGRVRQRGDPIALVVADSPETAAAALGAIAVDYRALPELRDPEVALAEGAPAVHPGGNLLAEHTIAWGDGDEALAASDIEVEATYTTPWNEHAYLEPEATLASWEDDILVVRTGTQYPHYHRAEVARVLGLPTERVRVVATVSGGAFGGKTDISGQCLAALGTLVTRRPVRIVYDRAESFESTTKRHPYRIHARAGATRDGRLTALRLDMLADTGAYASFGAGLMVKTFASATGPYHWPAAELHGRVVFTDNPTAGCMRGPGTTQAAFAIESQIDELARRLAMDPLELRLRNALSAGDRVPSGQVLDRDPAYARTIEAIRPYWDEAVARCRGADRGGGAVRRGVGVASIWYGIGGGGGGPTPGQDPALTVGRGPGRARIELLGDGSIVVRTGVVDLGQGAATALAMLAAAELGVPLERVAVEAGDTATCPDAGPTVGSRVTFFVGNAVRAAAWDLREAILGTAGRLLARPVGELEIEHGVVGVAAAPAEGRVDLATIAGARHEAGHATVFDATFDPEIPAFDPTSGLGEPYAMYVTGTQMAEVEVDVSSGAIRVLRVVAAHDVGSPAFEAGVVGQIEGGIAMGLGFALHEAFVPDRTRGFKDYRIPRSRDMPEMVTILVADPDDPEPLRLKGVAECSNMVVAPAVANAVADATGRRLVDLPLRLPPGGAV
jgi:aldehyde oxidoreductase